MIRIETDSQGLTVSDVEEGDFGLSPFIFIRIKNT